MGWAEIVVLVVQLVMKLPEIIAAIKDIISVIHSVKDPAVQGALRTEFGTKMGEALAMGDKGQCGAHLKNFLNDLHARFGQP